MKKIKILCIIFILIIAVPVFISDVPASVMTDAKEIPKELKIIAIGNSFSSNSLFYVYEMAKDLGTDEVIVGNLYIGSCSLKKHRINARDDNKAYKYYKKTAGEWEITDNVSISEALADEDWDYVMFLQYSGDAGKPSTYKPLNSLLKYVRKRVGKHTKFIWNMVWAFQSDYKAKRFGAYNYDQELMYEKIVYATEKKIKTNAKIDLIVPAGTAIQNARSSSFGDTFTTDGRHLTYAGRYIVGLTLLSTILDISPEEIKYRPKCISDEMRRVAAKAAS